MDYDNNYKNIVSEEQHADIFCCTQMTYNNFYYDQTYIKNVTVLYPVFFCLQYQMTLKALNGTADILETN